MMSSKYSKTKLKTAKSFETTLGKAPPPADKDDSDLSQLRQPINTSVMGLKQIMGLFSTATEEVKDYISYECELLYECRVCRTLFRSLANFILHKRTYCKDKYKPAYDSNCYSVFNFDQESDCDDDFQGDTNPSASDQKQKILHELNKIKKQEKTKQLSTVVNELTAKKRSDLNEADDDDDESQFEFETKSSKHTNVFLEKIDTTDAAVFQSVVTNQTNEGGDSLMKSEVMELHSILDSDEVIFDCDGKLHDAFAINSSETDKSPLNSDESNEILICHECGFRFSTRKTLTSHIKYKHNAATKLYLCPDCNESFVNPWCVYRHLYKVHKRSMAQVKRLRFQINTSTVTRHQLSAVLKKSNQRYRYESLNTLSKSNKPWLDSCTTGNNHLQMCRHCGKRFERRAALQSHIQLCSKRTLLNTDKKTNNLNQNTNSNSQGNTSTQKKNHINCNKRIDSVNDNSLPQGAAKRKYNMKQPPPSNTNRKVKIGNNNKVKTVKNTKVQPVCDALKDDISNKSCDDVIQDSKRNKNNVDLNTEELCEIIGVSPSNIEKFEITNEDNSGSNHDNNYVEISSDESCVLLDDDVKTEYPDETEINMERNVDKPVFTGTTDDPLCIEANRKFMQYSNENSSNSEANSITLHIDKGKVYGVDTSSQSAFPDLSINSSLRKFLPASTFKSLKKYTKKLQKKQRQRNYPIEKSNQEFVDSIDQFSSVSDNATDTVSNENFNEPLNDPTDSNGNQDISPDNKSYNRPHRLRKSVKTAQDDYIYDFKQVIELNAMHKAYIRRSKLKKHRRPRSQTAVGDEKSIEEVEPAVP